MKKNTILVIFTLFAISITYYLTKAPDFTEQSPTTPTVNTQPKITSLPKPAIDTKKVDQQLTNSETVIIEPRNQAFDAIISAAPELRSKTKGLYKRFTNDKEGLKTVRDSFHAGEDGDVSSLVALIELYDSCRTSTFSSPRCKTLLEEDDKRSEGDSTFSAFYILRNLANEGNNLAQASYWNALKMSVTAGNFNTTKNPQEWHIERSKALTWQKSLVHAGDPVAAMNLAIDYSEGIFIEADLSLAEVYALRAQRTGFNHYATQDIIDHIQSLENYNSNYDPEDIYERHFN